MLLIFMVLGAILRRSLMLIASFHKVYASLLGLFASFSEVFASFFSFMRLFTWFMRRLTILPISSLKCVDSNLPIY
ncbi:hypothetical protein KH172YL63_00880 [Bacillus sp. KH172YL63]|nr:hypothetical protein KH172YL63_00880 [Bacillus sp. KH172YL63]